MNIGILSATIAPDRLARAVEERGFESLWVPEHTHIPVPADGSDNVRDPAGGNVGEMGHHGVAFEDRLHQTRERIDALKALWTQEKPSFDGQYVAFEKLWLYPKPQQQPHPPIVLGTLDTPFGRAQVVQHGDGWLPLTFDVNATRKSVEDVRARMRDLGRDASRLDVSLFFLEDKEQTLATLRAAQETKPNRIILRMPVAAESVVLRLLDRYAAIAIS